MVRRQILVGPDGDEIDVAEVNEVLDQHGLKMRIGRRFQPGAFDLDAHQDLFDSDETFVQIYIVGINGRDYLENDDTCAPRDQIRVMKKMIEQVCVGQYDMPRWRAVLVRRAEDLVVPSARDQSNIPDDARNRGS